MESVLLHRSSFRIFALFYCVCLFYVLSPASQITSRGDRNLGLRIGTESFGDSPAPEPSQKVSGTFVRIPFFTDCGLDVNWDGTDGWENATVDKLEVLLPEGGSVEWTTASHPDPPFIFPIRIQGVLRFASTHFSDQTSIDFTVKATWTLTRTGEPPKILTITKTISVIAYNKLIAFCVDGIAEAPPIPGQANYQLCITGGSHEGYFGSPDYHVTKTMISNHLHTQTVFVANVHSNNYFYGDSLFTAESDGPTHLITPSENGTYAYSTRPSTTPDMNMAFIYGCKTMSSPSDDTWALSFGVSQSTDRAYAGFSQVITWSWGENEQYKLSVHALILFDELKSGKNILQAVAKANTDTHCDPDKKMRVIGDERSRLFLEYLNALEFSAASTTVRNSWFYKE